MRFELLSAVAAAAACALALAAAETRYTLRRAWEHSHTLARADDGADLVDHPHVLPPPIAVRFGSAEIAPHLLLATHDDRIEVRAVEASPRPSAPSSSSTGLLTLRASLQLAARPVALGVGSSSLPGAKSKKDVVAVLTSDWKVQLLTHQLEPVWQRSLLGSNESAVPLEEGCILVSPTPIYEGDEGIILVGGYWAEEVRSPPSAGASAVPTARFTVYALELSSGDERWRRDSETRESHPPEDLAQGVEDTDGSSPFRAADSEWSHFRSSVLRELPHAWRHPHETALRLGAFSREQREPSARRRAAALSSHAAAAGGASSFRNLPRVVAGGAPTVATAAAAANVVLSLGHDGVDVLHLYTGRRLCHLALPQEHALSLAPQAHADINGDLSIDHVVARGGSESECAGIAGGDARELHELWSAPICQARPSRRRERRHYSRRRDLLFDAAAPLLLRRLGGGGSTLRGMDAVFLVSSGLLSSYGPDGQPNWRLETKAGWLALSSGSGGGALKAAGVQSMLPSVSPLKPTAASAAAVLALGSHHAVLVSARGHLLGELPLPSMPVAPPIVGDFDGDGKVDVIIATSTGYVGVRLVVTAGSIMHRLFYAFLALLVLVQVLLSRRRRRSK